MAGWHPRTMRFIREMLMIGRWNWLTFWYFVLKFTKRGLKEWSGEWPVMGNMMLAHTIVYCISCCTSLYMRWFLLLHKISYLKEKKKKRSHHIHNSFFPYFSAYDFWTIKILAQSSFPMKKEKKKKQLSEELGHNKYTSKENIVPVDPVNAT